MLSRNRKFKILSNSSSKKNITNKQLHKNVKQYLFKSNINGGSMSSISTSTSTSTRHRSPTSIIPDIICVSMIIDTLDISENLALLLGDNKPIYIYMNKDTNILTIKQKALLLYSTMYNIEFDDKLNIEHIKIKNKFDGIEYSKRDDNKLITSLHKKFAYRIGFSNVFAQHIEKTLQNAMLCIKQVKWSNNPSVSNVIKKKIISQPISETIV